jgi:hypothetical protein
MERGRYAIALMLLGIAPTLLLARLLLVVWAGARAEARRRGEGGRLLRWELGRERAICDCRADAGGGPDAPQTLLD